MYDVVVVGAGAAGCVVARRLADAGRTVLLLESGPDLRADVPPDFRDGWDFPRRHEWGFQSEPDDRGSAVPVRRGRLLGGTSWVTRFAVRGCPADFDRWVELGCAGWRFDDVLPWFTRLETDLDFPGDAWHGASGPMPVTRYPVFADSDFVDAVTQACAATGIPVVDDHNRPGVEGVARMPMTSHDGMRVTTADAYLPVGGEPATLTIRADTLVASIALEQGRALGVHLLDGTLVEGGRVVVCGGVYGSPTLLLRSGIGPADHLGRFGITVAADLPGVGANLADHPEIEVDPGYRGPVVDRPQLHTLARFRSGLSDSGQPPDLALWVADPVGDPEATTIEVLLMTPASRGAVRLRSPDPADQPAIRLPCLDDPGDVDRLTEGLRRARELATGLALRRVCEAAPATRHSDPDEVRAWIRHERSSVPHTVGTCAMGTAPDDGAVVDAFGDVHGVTNLSVIDASIIPMPPSGFPHLVTIMLAERLSSTLDARL
jgi:choline dehydrogenase